MTDQIEYKKKKIYKKIPGRPSKWWFVICKELGFEEDRGSDPVFKEKYGYDYFFMRLKLNKKTKIKHKGYNVNYHLDWGPENRELMYSACYDDANTPEDGCLLFKRKVNDLDELSMIFQQHFLYKDDIEKTLLSYISH